MILNKRKICSQSVPHNINQEQKKPIVPTSLSKIFQRTSDFLNDDN